ncbi:tyrosine-type recombinase/integrase [Saccharothrix deserti]|uniref:tyrosine-type recombinase/integrase n=1 Tax=Saccharothrix deserti TaxID=2593674 RepID=UPI00131B8A8D|nr:tyrosine-type recombinase/integrase [Saccharothrix deserti]
MARTKKTRQPNGTSSVYYGKDGYWHGRVTVGTKDDGTPDRRHVMRKDEGEVRDKVRELENQRDSGEIRKAGAKRWRVREWLTHWVENIAAPSVRYKTLEGYRTAVYKHVIPALGQRWMDQTEAEHFEKLYAKMLRSGDFKPGTVHQVHRTARTAWREARKRKVIRENPFDLVKAPRLEEDEIEPFEPEEVQALMTAALTRRNGVRFILALAIGTRKGESLGFRWSRLNTTTKVLRVSKQRQRQTYEHGCSDPAACITTRHKTKPCPAACKKHKKCPPPCPVGCVKHARYCPERIGGILEVDVKSSKGRRGIRLPDQLFELLMSHKETQDKEREVAGDLWQEGDWMFTQPNGKPLDPRADHDEWKRLLTDAGVRDARLHDARHTAATVLLLLGVRERAVMDFMGWSNTKVAERYMHVTAAMRDDIAHRLSGFLWTLE